MAEEEEFDTDWTSLPKCPHCGAEDQDWWDGLGHKHDGDDWEVDCAWCDKQYIATMHITYDFSTVKPEPKASS